MWLRHFDFILILNRTNFRIFSREIICFIISDDPSSCRITRRGSVGRVWPYFGGDTLESEVGWGRGEGDMGFRFVIEIGPEDLARGLAMGWGEKGVTVRDSTYDSGLIWGVAPFAEMGKRQ